MMTMQVSSPAELEYIEHAWTLIERMARCHLGLALTQPRPETPEGVSNVSRSVEA
jgi:hypothetical protein